MNPYLTGAGRSLLIAAIAFVVVGSIASSWPLLLVGVALSALLLLAFHAMLPSVLALERRLLKIELALPDPATQGVLLTGRSIGLGVRVKNRAGARLRGLRLVPHMGSGLSLVEDVPANLRLPGYSELETDMEVVALETGRWPIHGFEVRIRDLLGLFEVGEYVACTTLLKVLPDAVAGMSARPPSLKALAQQRAGLHFVVRKGFGMELRELRNHQHGDPFRSIAWKATARTGRLMVKEYESELILNTYVCLDISSTMRGGFRHDVTSMPSKLEHGLRLAFSFAEMSVRHNDRVGLTTFDEKLYGHLRPKEGRGHLANLLHHLVGVRHVVDSELTEYGESEVVDALVRYLLVQERLDFRRSRRNRATRGVGQGLDYWSFSRDVDRNQQDDAIYDIDLLQQWLKLVVPQEDERLGDPALQLGIVDAHELDVTRRFCQLRGIEIPYRIEARLGQKERGMVQAFESILGASREGHFIFVVTDLCGIMNPEPITAALRMLLAKRHKIAFVMPFTPSYVETAEMTPAGEVLHDIFERAERVERAQEARAVQKLGIPVISVGPADNLNSVLQRLGRQLR